MSIGYLELTLKAMTPLVLLVYIKNLLDANNSFESLLNQANCM